MVDSFAFLPVIFKNDLETAADGGREGSWGGRLEGGVGEERNWGSTDRLHGQCLPKPTSLVTFLFGTRK